MLGAIGSTEACGVGEPANIPCHHHVGTQPKPPVPGVGFLRSRGHVPPHPCSKGEGGPITAEDANGCSEAQIPDPRVSRGIEPRASDGASAGLLVSKDWEAHAEANQILDDEGRADVGEHLVPNDGAVLFVVPVPNQRLVGPVPRDSDDGSELAPIVEGIGDEPVTPPIRRFKPIDRKTILRVGCPAEQHDA